MQYSVLSSKKGDMGDLKGDTHDAKGRHPGVPSQRQCHYVRSFDATLRTPVNGEDHKPRPEPPTMTERRLKLDARRVPR